MIERVLASEQQWHVELGDALVVLRSMPDACVRTCVTSPPYFGLRDYGVEGQVGLEKTPADYVSRLVEIFTEVHRLLTKDGTLWLNIGDSYCAAPRGSDNGWDKSRLTNPGSVQKRQRAAMRDHRSFPGLKPKDLIGIPWMVAFALRGLGYWLRSDIIWAKPNNMPESVRDRPTSSHEHVFLLSKRRTYFYDGAAIREPDVGADHPRRDIRPPEPSGGVHPPHKGLRKPEGRNGEGANKRDVWRIATTPYKGSHDAVMPKELAATCIKAGSEPGDVVLDPFVGSGTSGLVARRLQRRFVGIDISSEYVQMATDRIAWDADRRSRPVEELVDSEGTLFDSAGITEASA